MAASTATTAATLEGQALQVATRLQLAEQTYNIANPETPVNNVTITSDIEAGTVTVAMTLPATISEANGAITATALAYLP
jgi:hypothetical protein